MADYFGDSDRRIGYRFDLGNGRSAYIAAVSLVDAQGNPVSPGGGGSGGPTTIANGADAAEGSTTDAAYTDRTGAASGTVISVLKGLFTGVVGNVASGATDAGNPVKIGGLVSTGAPPNFTNGQRGDSWLSSNGAMVIAAVANAPTDAMQNGAILSPAANNGNGVRSLSVASQVFNGTSWDRQRGDTNGSYTVSKGSGSIATAQVSVGTTSTQIVAARSGRGSVKITNLGTNDVYIGNTGVTLTTGDLLPGTKGASITVPANVAIFGIATAAQAVSVMEVF